MCILIGAPVDCWGRQGGVRQDPDSGRTGSGRCVALGDRHHGWRCPRDMSFLPGNNSALGFPRLPAASVVVTPLGSCV